MPVAVRLTHETRYRYDRVVVLSPQLIRLRPAPHTRARVCAYELTVMPEAHFLTWLQDPFGNWQARVVLAEPVDALSVTVSLSVAFQGFNPFDFFVEPQAAAYPFAYAPVLRRQLDLYLQAPPPGARLIEWLAQLPPGAGETVAMLTDLNRAVHRDIAYRQRFEPGVQTPETTLELGCGSCRDSAWLLVLALRQRGLAARFVSGYLVQLAAPLEVPDQAAGERDRADLHAWAEVYLPGAGWIGLDPTSGLLAGEGHIPLSATPEPSESAPISGTVEPCKVHFDHAIRIARLPDAPRP